MYSHSFTLIAYKLRKNLSFGRLPVRASADGQIQRTLTTPAEPRVPSSDPGGAREPTIEKSLRTSNPTCVPRPPAGERFLNPLPYRSSRPSIAEDLQQEILDRVETHGQLDASSITRLRTPVRSPSIGSVGSSSGRQLRMVSGSSYELTGRAERQPDPDATRKRTD